MTKEEWAACAAMLATFYPHSFKLESKEAVKLWFDELKDLPGERVHAAIKHMVRSQTAFPSVADIRRLAEPPKISWGEGWAEVMKAVGEVGMYGAPTWSDPAIGRAVEALGGWEAICQTPNRDHPALRAHFRAELESALADGHREATFAQLGVQVPKRIGKPKAMGELLEAILPEVPRC